MLGEISPQSIMRFYFFSNRDGAWRYNQMRMEYAHEFDLLFSQTFVYTMSKSFGYELYELV